MKTLRGTYPIVPTPFDESGKVDEESIGSLTAFMVGKGVQGLAILGVMGEANKLSEDERATVVRVFRRALPTHLDLVVGVAAGGTDVAIANAKSALDLGADALLVAPVPLQNDDVMFAYYERVARSVSAPIILHDYPASTGTFMGVSLIARLHAELPSVSYIKLEDPPTGLKMAKLRERAGSMGVFGALGGMYAFEELDRGALGIMTGFAYPELLVELQRRIDAGERDSAARLFYDMVPLIRFEFQPGIGIALRKQILVQRGAIRSAVVRHPGGHLDPATLEHLEMVTAHLRSRGILAGAEVQRREVGLAAASRERQ